MESLMEVKRSVYSISDFLEWQRAGVLELSPKYQRRSVWRPHQKSFLIDTIIRDLPVPIIFVRDRKPDIRSLKKIKEVIDGQQRIRTILSFIDPGSLADFDTRRDSFVIKKVHNPELGGKVFDDLDDETKSRILDYQFSVHTLSSDTSDREIYSIFSRINSTGARLNPQELRNAAYFGEFKSSQYALSMEQLHRWKQWGIFSDHDFARMAEVELMSELSIFVLNGITGKTKGIIDKWYKDLDESYERRTVVEGRIRIVFDKIDDILGDKIKDSSIKHYELFYASFAIFYDFMYGVGSKLASMRPKAVPNSIVKLIQYSETIRGRETGVREIDNNWTKGTVESRKAVVKFLRNKLS